MKRQGILGQVSDYNSDILIHNFSFHTNRRLWKIKRVQSLQRSAESNTQVSTWRTYININNNERSRVTLHFRSHDSSILSLKTDDYPIRRLVGRFRYLNLTDTLNTTTWECSLSFIRLPLPFPSCTDVGLDAYPKAYSNTNRIGAG
jgi:hypothetical protein